MAKPARTKSLAVQHLIQEKMKNSNVSPEGDNKNGATDAIVSPGGDKQNVVDGHVSPQGDNPKSADNNLVSPGGDKTQGDNSVSPSQSEPQKTLVSPEGDNPKGETNTHVSPEGDKGGISELPVKNIKPWGYANRHEDDFGDSDEWHEFVQSIRLSGVDQPVIVRKISGVDEYELICGRRRYTASIECGRETIPAIVKTLTDREAAAMQDRENELRKGISSWYRAQHWQSLLDGGLFETQEQLGSAMGVERKYVSKIMTFNRIDSDIAAAIKPKNKVSVKTAIAIVSLTKVSESQTEKDVQENKKLIIEMADKIASGALNDVKLKPAIYKRRKPNETKPEEPKYGTVRGVKCFEVKLSRSGAPVISIDKNAASLVSLDQIVEHLETLYGNVIKD